MVNQKALGSAIESLMDEKDTDSTKTGYSMEKLGQQFGNGEEGYIRANVKMGQLMGMECTCIQMV